MRRGWVSATSTDSSVVVPSERVTVTVAADGDARASVAVADTGPGMSPERVATLFDGPEIHDSAAGIGLPASRRISSLLGGTIEVASAPTKGSVFTLRIPRQCLEFVHPSEG